MGTPILSGICDNYGMDGSRHSNMMVLHSDGESTAYHPFERLCKLCPGFDEHYERLIQMEKRAEYCAYEAKPSGYGEQQSAEWIIEGGEYPAD